MRFLCPFHLIEKYQKIKALQLIDPLLIYDLDGTSRCVALRFCAPSCDHCIMWVPDVAVEAGGAFWYE